LYFFFFWLVYELKNKTLFFLTIIYTLYFIIHQTIHYVYILLINTVKTKKKKKKKIKKKKIKIIFSKKIFFINF